MAAEIGTELRKYRSLTIALIAGITVSVVMFVTFLSVDLDETRREIGMQSRLTSLHTQNQLQHALTGIANSTHLSRMTGSVSAQDQALALELSIADLELGDILGSYCIWSGDKATPLIAGDGSCLDNDARGNSGSFPLDLPGGSRGSLAIYQRALDDTTLDLFVAMPTGLQASFAIAVKPLLTPAGDLDEQELHKEIETCLYLALESGPVNAGCNQPPTIPAAAEDPGQFAASSPMSYDATFSAAGQQWRIVSALAPSAMVSAISIYPIAILIFFLVATGFVCSYVYSATGTNLRLRKQQAQINAGLQELRKRNEDLEQFAYMASHDLQTPVRHIMSRATMLQDDLNDGDYSEAAHNTQVILNASKRMQAFILDLLAFCRAGEDQVTLTEVDVEQLVDEQLSMIRDVEKPMGMCVNTGDLPTLRTDRIKLGQVLQNLLTNAMKFRRDETPLMIDIDASLDAGKREWCFEVRDNGIGIAEEHYERIFLPFKQLDARQKAVGTGVGLSIAKKVIERMGGRIWVESRPGQGSSFYFTVPGVYTGPGADSQPASAPASGEEVR